MFQQSVGNFTSKFVRNEINSVQILNIQNKTSENFVSFFGNEILIVSRERHACLDFLMSALRLQ